MKYISTRNASLEVSGAEAIVAGIAPDGGLFVPKDFPTIDSAEIEKLCELDYPERAAYVLAKFLDDFGYDELLQYTKKAYDRFYGDPCPLVDVDSQVYILELWHGPTAAFKDMALTLLPYLMTASRKKTGQKDKTLILVATSGDTGKAALEGFKDVDGTEIMVFYPSEGVSEMQKAQMVTQQGDNVFVAGIKGNFDDAQTAVKRIFADEEIKSQLLQKGYKLSSANSINWGRLAPQIAYYISAYCDLLSSGEIEEGEEVNFCVPSGNFGNILACYYAKRMGLPVKKMICASNKNNILTDFFASGKYDAKREFYKTKSPSMDILVSSNLERLLFEISGRNDAFVAEKMQQLKNEGEYSIEAIEIKKHAGDFVGGFATELDTDETIDNFYEIYDYLLDPHTAVAACVYDIYNGATGDDAKTVIVSTASPFKFPTDVYSALTQTQVDDAFKAQKKLASYTGEDIPQPLDNLQQRAIRFDEVIDKEDIDTIVLRQTKSN